MNKATFNIEISQKDAQSIVSGLRLLVLAADKPEFAERCKPALQNKDLAQLNATSLQALALIFEAAPLAHNQGRVFPCVSPNGTKHTK